MENYYVGNKRRELDRCSMSLIDLRHFVLCDCYNAREIGLEVVVIVIYKCKTYLYF